MNVKFIFPKSTNGQINQTLLSIPQTHLNVKFILRKFSKNVDFVELPFTVVLSIP